MTIVQIIKTGSKVYNEAGYRLVSIVNLSVPEKISAKGVNLIKRAIIKHKNGEEKYIESWLNKEGKAMRTIHSSSLKPDEKIVTDYEWTKPKVFDVCNMYHDYLKKDDPYTFENLIGRIRRVFCVKDDKGIFQNQKIRYTNLDINNEHKVITKSIGVYEANTNTSEIYSIQKGKKTKGLFLKSQKQQDGTYKVVDSNYYGISKEDAQDAFKDEYFHSRFLSPVLMAKCCVAQAAKKQGVSYIPQLVKSPYADHGIAIYDKKSIGLMSDIIEGKMNKFEVADVLAHESKHLSQKELVEKYLKGELSDPNEIVLAKRYKDNYDNYITPFKDNIKYRRQFLEEEAYKEGFKARHSYFDSTSKLKQIFEFSSNKSTGA